MRICSKLLVILLIIIFTGCSKDNSVNNSTPQFTTVYEPTPTIFCNLDVKTHYYDKFNATGMKNGLNAYINDTQWGYVIEYGEKYSVWINNVIRTKNKNTSTIHLDFDFELHEPSNLTDGYVIKTKHITLDYETDKDFIDQAGNASANKVASKLLKYAQMMKVAGKLAPKVNNMVAKYINVQTGIPAPLIEKLLSKIVSYMTSDEKLQEFQAEGIIIGAELCSQLQTWLVEQGN